MLYRTLVTVCFLAAAPGGMAGAATPTAAHVNQILSTLPLAFEANRGQFSEHVDFAAIGPRYLVALAPAHVGVTDGGRKLRINFLGANPHSRFEALDPMPGKRNYFLGRARPVTDVPTFARVRNRDVYPGIDVVFYGNQQELEFDFVLHPQADPKAIRLKIAGAGMTITSGGDARFAFARGEVKLRRPVVYQDIAGRRKQIAGRYVQRSGGEIGFELGQYDRAEPLVIDPVLSYSTIFSSDGGVEGVAADAAGNVYVTGSAQNFNELIPGANNTPHSQATEGFVLKLNTNLTGAASVVYGTYLGGTRNDTLGGIAVDSSGNAYVAGSTDSLDFPTTPGAYLGSVPNTGFTVSYAVAAKLNPSGNALAFSTYIGQGGIGGPHSGLGTPAVTLDGSGNLWMIGTTQDPNFPVTPNRVQSVHGGNTDAFVAGLNVTGSALVFSSLLGGPGEDWGIGVAIDSAGNVYAGVTTGAQVVQTNATGGMPVTPNAFQSQPQGVQDGYVAKISLQNGLVYGTYLGGTGPDGVLSIAADAAGNAYLALFSSYLPSPTNFPVTSGNTALPTNILVKLNAGGSLVYAMAVNGSTAGPTPISGNPYGLTVTGQIAVDTLGRVFMTGQTSQPDFPTTSDAFEPALTTSVNDGFLAVVNSSGNGLVYSTHLRGVDNGIAIALDKNANVYVAGNVNSTQTFPVTSPISSSGGNIFVAKYSGIGGTPDLGLTKTHTGSFTVGVNATYTLSITNAGTAVASGASVTDTLPAGMSFVSAAGSGWSCSASRQTVNCSTAATIGPGQSSSLQLTVAVDFPAVGTPLNTATVSTSGDTNSANNGASDATAVVVQPSIGIDVLANKVKSLGLPPGRETALTAPLQASQQALANGNRQAAINSLNGFTGQVQASQRQGAISADSAAYLMSGAQAVINAI